MRRKLKTTPLRVVLAALLGWAVPMGLVCSLSLFSDDPLAELETIYGFLAGLAVIALIPLVAPGLPLWILFHRLGARARTAAVAGGAAGVAVVAVFGVLIWRAQGDWAVMDSIVLALFAAAGGGVGALTCFLMWKIAYPKSLQPVPPAEHF